jgi:anti-sigma B factor antagonist
MTGIPLWTAAVTTHDNTRTVALTGEIDLAGADELLRLLVTELDGPGVTMVVGELADVDFLDSAGLGAFVGAYNHAVRVGRRFHLINPGRSVLRVLEISGVDEVLVA